MRKILRFLPQSWEAKVTAIQEAKDMKKISLDELIGNLQTYELRRNSQQKEEIKKDRGIALKVLEEDSSDLDEEEMAMITQKFKKFFKKAKEKSKNRNFSRSRDNDREQFSGCFKCCKRDHIVKNCTLLKDEQEPEQSKKQDRKQGGNSSARRFSRAMLAAWGDSTEDDEGTEEEDAIVALMARSDTDSDDELLDNLVQLKDKVRGLNKAKPEDLLFTLMDECDSINYENCMLKDICSELKRDVRKLEHANEILKSERLKVDEETLVLYEDLDKLKETLSVREKVFNIDLSKLESQSLQLK